LGVLFLFETQGLASWPMAPRLQRLGTVDYGVGVAACMASVWRCGSRHLGSLRRASNCYPRIQSPGRGTLSFVVSLFPPPPHSILPSPIS
jgi:hypothetical protein